MLISMGACPYCGNGTNTPCFATYDDGYKCFSCGKCKKHNNVFGPKRQKHIDGLVWPERGTWSVGNKRELYSLHFNDEAINNAGMYEDIDGNVIIPTSTGWLSKNFKTKKKRHAGVKQPEMLGNGSPIVIVEDILSALRLSTICRAVCLHGLFLPKETAKDIVKQNNDIIVWLDGDERGQAAALKVGGMLRVLVGIWYTDHALTRTFKHVRNVCTEQDPKCYSDEQLINIIFNAGVYL